MKIIQILAIQFLLLCLIACTNPTTTSDENKMPSTGSISKATAIDGAWELVWAKYNDTLQDVEKKPMFKMFHDGVFSLFARDSAGKISFAGFGNYELSDNNIYKETFRYHTYPPFKGAINWQEYELRNDTLYFKGFSKVIVDGKEVTNDFNKIEERRVKVKF